MFLKLRTFYTFFPNPLTEINFSGSVIDTVKYDIYINKKIMQAPYSSLDTFFHEYKSS